MIDQTGEASADFRSGFVAILGRPNAGKSTLLNVFVGEKVAIVTPKPQTTRRRIRAIRTTDDYQMIFVDTPGLMEPRDLLNKALVNETLDAIADADVLLYVLDGTKGLTEADRFAIARAAERPIPLICAINKVDKIQKETLLPLIERVEDLAEWREIIPVSATTGDGVAELTGELAEELPEGPMLYPREQLSDLNERFRAGEIIREKLFMALGEELPYSVAVEVVSFEELDHLNRISAKIHVERDSQKGIVIGRGGSMLKQVGRLARQELELLWQKKVFLELRVDVVKSWTKDLNALRRFGYDPRER